MRQTTIALLIDGAVAVIIAVSATVLLALGKIDAQTAIALYSTSVVLIGGSAKTLLALHVPAPAPAAVPLPAVPTLPAPATGP